MKNKHRTMAVLCALGFMLNIAIVFITSGTWWGVQVVSNIVLGALFGYHIVRWRALGEVSVEDMEKNFPTLYMAHGGVVPPSEKSAVLGLFCEDCGKRLQTLRRQTGYHKQTGQPKWDFELQCPDATPYTNGFPYCNKKSYAPAMMAAHVHSGEEISTDCPACIDVMVTDGVINSQQAASLYQAAKVTLRKERYKDSRSYLTSWYPAIYGSGTGTVPTTTPSPSKRRGGGTS